MRISDGSSDVCSSDLADRAGRACGAPGGDPRLRVRSWRRARSGSAWRGPQEGICSMSAAAAEDWTRWVGRSEQLRDAIAAGHAQAMQATLDDSEPLLHPGDPLPPLWHWAYRSEEHTSELQSLMRISYAVFCLKKKKNT